MNDLHEESVRIMGEKSRLLDSESTHSYAVEEALQQLSEVKRSLESVHSQRERTTESLAQAKRRLAEATAMQEEKMEQLRRVEEEMADQVSLPPPLDLYWRSPESGDLSYKSRQLKKMI